MKNPRYEVIALNADLIVLVDLGPHDVYPTITNGAEAVIAQLQEQGLTTARRVFYFDSEGELAELTFTDEGFQDFHYVGISDPMSDRLQAIRRGKVQENDSTLS
jgi:hypothetical protein